MTMLTDEEKTIIVQEAKAGGTASFTTPEALDLRRQADEALAHAAATMVAPPNVVAPVVSKRTKPPE